VPRRWVVSVVLLSLSCQPLVRTPVNPLESPAKVPPAAPAPKKTVRTGDPTLDFLEVLGRFGPESLSEIGIAGHEDDIIDLGPNLGKRLRAALEEELHQTKAAFARETDESKRDDIAIVRRAIELAIEEESLDEKRSLPHVDLGSRIFSGLRPHLRAPGSEAHALARLRRYAGVDGTPITALAQARTRERLDAPGILFPTKAELEDELAKLPVYLDELDALFRERAIAGHEEPWKKLRAALESHAEFIRSSVLPRARSDFRLPPDIYAFLLKKTGVDIAPAELVARARAAYAQTLAEMRTLAAKIGKKRGWPAGEVMARLKKDQRTGDALLSLYRQRLVDLEAIIRREKILTLPATPVSFRLATAGESAQNPAPTLDVGALFKKDAPIDFIMPSGLAPKPGEKAEDLAYTDFTYEAVSWTLAAHEARPGHELQFTAMKERGLSLARTLFAFNSVNVEGWGLYAEYLVRPFMPEEAQLASLRMKALREARAFLDCGLHDGTLTVDDARRLLRDELSFSEGVIRQEIDRYTFLDPTQATSYFYGLQRLFEIRKQAEEKLGPAFDQQAFHDFILGQGLLPPALLEKAVLTRFVAKAP
jgi:hypothetical protein